MFDMQIIDEAFQLPDYRYQLISNLAPRHALIGDPGQIDPFVNCEIERWRCDPSGPQVACPVALVKRHPTVLQLALPVSRRLNADTVSIIQPLLSGHAIPGGEPGPVRRFPGCRHHALRRGLGRGRWRRLDRHGRTAAADHRRSRQRTGPGASRLDLAPTAPPRPRATAPSESTTTRNTGAGALT
jgi:hypothetical protein